MRPCIHTQTQCTSGLGGVSSGGCSPRGFTVQALFQQTNKQKDASRDFTVLLQRHQARDFAHFTLGGLWCVEEVGNCQGQGGKRNLRCLLKLLERVGPKLRLGIVTVPEAYEEAPNEGV